MSLAFEPFVDESGRVHRFLTTAEGLGRYTIEVSLPPGPIDAGGGLPVIVVLDGNLFFDTVQSVAHGRMAAAGPFLPSAVIVGVGYPPDEGMASFYARRNYDFHPPWDMTDAMGQLIVSVFGLLRAADRKPELVLRAGGYERFMEFLRAELLPALAERFPIDLGKRHALVGDSSGGFFALRSLFDPSSPFRRVVAISPSFGAAAGAIEAAEAAWSAGNDDLDRDVFVCCGSEELAGDRRAVGRFGSGVAWLAETSAIRQWRSARIQWEIMNNEDHTSVGPRAVAAGLRSVFRCRPGVDEAPRQAAALMLEVLKQQGSDPTPVG
ncbi:MAG: alpha/beta hydrolase [Gemmatimonadales bacterium]